MENTIDNHHTLFNLRYKLLLVVADSYKYEQYKVNQFINDIRLLIKIPANREDLLTETLLLNELSTIFSLKKYEIWKNLKNERFTKYV